MGICGHLCHEAWQYPALQYKVTERDPPGCIPGRRFLRNCHRSCPRARARGAVPAEPAPSWPARSCLTWRTSTSAAPARRMTILVIYISCIPRLSHGSPEAVHGTFRCPLTGQGPNCIQDKGASLLLHIHLHSSGCFILNFPAKEIIRGQVMSMSHLGQYWKLGSGAVGDDGDD